MHIAPDGRVDLTPTEISLPDALFVHRDDGRLVAVNRHTSVLTGYTREELLAMSVLDLDTAFDLPRAQQLWQALSTDTTTLIHGRHRAKDGRLYPVEVHIGVIVDRGSRLYVGVARDISARLAQEEELRLARERLLALETERRERAESELAKSLERYRGVFDSCIVAIVMARASDGVIVDVNPAFEAISGYARVEVLGRTTLDLDMWVNLADRDEFLRRVRSGEVITGVSCWFRRKGGETREQFLTGRVVRIGDEHFMVGQLVDTTELNEARDALARERALVQAIVDHSPNGLLMLAPDGTHIWHNARLVEMLEYPPGFLRPGMPLEEVVRFNHDRGDYGQEPFESAYARTAAFAQAREPTRYERHAKGGTVVLEVDVVPMPGTGFLVSYADVTLRRLNEQRLERLVDERTDELRRSLLDLMKARDAAESANRAKSVFLSNMGHELRTPLNGVLGMAGLLKRGDLTEKQRDQVGKIERAGRQLTALLSQLLDLAQLEADRMPLASEPVRLVAVRSALEERFAAAISAKGIAYAFDIEPALEEAGLRGDARRLEQALAQLLDNAVKFTSSGEIRVQARVERSRPGEVVARFVVRDTGIGIAPEDAAHLFKPFQQLDDGNDRRYGGAGLGLAIARRLAVLMGGEMGVDSQPGRGSTFWFTARFAT